MARPYRVEWGENLIIEVKKMTIANYTTFEDWFKDNMIEYAKDIASHGADAGYPHITYTAHTVEIFDKFASEIWEMAVEDAEAMGYKNVAEMVAEFGRSDMLENLNNTKSLMVWYGCEKIARQLVNEKSE